MAIEIDQESKEPSYSRPMETAGEELCACTGRKHCEYGLNGISMDQERNKNSD